MGENNEDKVPDLLAILHADWTEDYKQARLRLLARVQRLVEWKQVVTPQAGRLLRGEVRRLEESLIAGIKQVWVVTQERQMKCTLLERELEALRARLPGGDKKDEVIRG